MASHITLDEAKSWLEQTKLVTGSFSVDTDLERQVSDQVLARLSAVYDVSTWADVATTPALVRSIIAMLYDAWIYDRAYGDDDDDENNYARILRANAEALLTGIIAGSIDIPDVDNPNGDAGTPAFFPTDASSSQPPSCEFPSNGPPAFSMGHLW